ncbi:MAG: hypothetical protein HKP01_04915 [Gemmatimonadetes bacterium]|nr:hypothetical protein [Gemmatimonadota bacterium]
MKRIVLRFVVSGLCAYALFGLVGLAATPSLGPSLSDGETLAALAFSFPAEGGDWTEASGYASPGWLYRRAYVAGTSQAGVRCSEQVLKAGWPFTVVRGFARSGGGDHGNEGVGWISNSRPGEPARLLPIEPVWPGIVLYGLLGVLAWYMIPHLTILSERPSKERRAC